MRKLTTLMITFALFLAACAGAAQQTTEPAELPVTGTEVVPAATAEITVEPPAAVTVEPQAPAAASPTVGASGGASEPGMAVVTEAAQPDGAAGSGTVTYSLVPEESTVTYEVGETFVDRGNVINTAIGQTQGVTGNIQVNFNQPEATTVEALSVDVSGFRSDSSRRDGAIRDRFLQSAQYPTVTFTPTAIEGLPAAIEPGVDYPLTLRGDLTIRETTKPAAFDAVVRWEDPTLTGQATTTVLMSDFGFGPIEILGMLSTEDEVKITVDFVARPQ